MSTFLFTYRILFLVLVKQSTDMSNLINIFAHLLFMNILTSNSKFMNYMEKANLPITFKNFDFGFTMPYHIIMLTGLIFIHSFLVWYLQQILPGSYMRPKKWWFLFDFMPKVKDEKDYAGQAIPKQYLEYAGPPLQEALFCNRICKVDKKFEKLWNCTFKAYLGEVTVVTCHMEGGLSLAINIINGLIEPSSGNIKLFGKDITKYSRIGFINTCPPENSFFHKLTAAEHIEFMCKLKRLSYIDIARENKTWRHHCNFSFSTVVEKLSYDEQRLLNLACSMCGNIRVITMAQPTMNMTPRYKKIFWNIIRKELVGRTFIIGTNSLDEAFRLANRVAIIEDGLVKCYGTPYFLRTRIAGGYRLVNIQFSLHSFL